MAFNANDVLSIQESLVSYKLLLNWVPAVTKEEGELRYIRLATVEHLINLCESTLKEMKNE